MNGLDCMNVDAVKKVSSIWKNTLKILKIRSLPLVVAINIFAQDTPEELEASTVPIVLHMAINVACLMFCQRRRRHVELAKGCCAGERKRQG